MHEESILTCTEWQAVSPFAIQFPPCKLLSAQAKGAEPSHVAPSKTTDFWQPLGVVGKRQ